MAALYNEIDPKAAAWLRELIAQGHIAPGIVDERSIEDLDPDYLRQFTQVHFFAGIGVWPRALRDAGWRDDEPVWTGSCPCQPFSAAGKGAGFDDERHLWPAFHWLIEQCRPDVVLGEQVASKDGLAWFDLVSSDLEASGYAAGATDTCAAGFGAPHIRQRLYWCAVADADNRSQLPLLRARENDPTQDLRSRSAVRLDEPVAAGNESQLGRIREPSSLAQPHDAERRANLSRGDVADRTNAGRPEGPGDAGTCGGCGGMGDAFDQPRERDTRTVFGTQASFDGARVSINGPFDLGPEHAGAGMGRMADAKSDGHERRGQLGEPTGRDGAAHGGATDRPGPTNGLWGDVDWLLCRDGKWRPVEPGTFPLAHGAPARVGRLRGYGNAIVLPQAAAFVEAVIEWRAASDLC